MMRNHKFFARFSIAIGILVVGLIALAIKESDLTQSLDPNDTEKHRASVEDQIRPFGQVYMSGEEIDASRLQVQIAAQSEPAVTTLSGPQVYNAACIACHGSGIGGAPTIGDAAAWQARVVQGNDTLYLHAIEGYTGSTGFMPQKGGRLDLSDDEVRGAVDYMVSEL